MKHILFIVTSTNRTGTNGVKAGYEFSEIADPYREFVNQGFTVDFASIMGGSPPFVGYDPLKESDESFFKSKGFMRLNFSHQLDQINIDAYDGIFFPGGLGLMTDMTNNADVKAIIARAYESNKIIGAVCHGPAALLNVILSDGTNLLSGKRINSFTKREEELDKHVIPQVIPYLLEEELVEQGAVFVSGLPFESFVVNDENIVTGQNPASASGVAQKMIELVGD